MASSHRTKKKEVCQKMSFPMRKSYLIDLCSLKTMLHFLATLGSRSTWSFIDNAFYTVSCRHKASDGAGTRIFFQDKIYILDLKEYNSEQKLKDYIWVSSCYGKFSNFSRDQYSPTDTKLRVWRLGPQYWFKTSLWLDCKSKNFPMYILFTSAL